MQARASKDLKRNKHYNLLAPASAWLVLVVKSPTFDIKSMSCRNKRFFQVLSNIALGQLKVSIDRLFKFVSIFSFLTNRLEPKHKGKLSKGLIGLVAFHCIFWF